jgi:hypothetical protein
VKTIESHARVAIGVWIGEQFVLALLTAIASFTSVAFWAHVGGFAAGAGIGALYAMRVPVMKRPSFVAIELPQMDEIAEPNELVGLNLSATPAKLVSGDGVEAG